MSKKKAREYVLYGSRNSGSAAVEAALELTGAPYRIVDAATWNKTAAFEELKRVNPLHQIPTLVTPDGSVLSESAAILIHLGLAHPRAKLLPANASQRAQAIRAMVFIAANCYAAIGVIDYPERWCKGGGEAEHDIVRDGARARLHGYWNVFADQFANSGTFLAGAQPGALDLLAAVVSRWSGARAHLKKERPALHALLQRVEQQSDLAPVFARHWPA